MKIAIHQPQYWPWPPYLDKVMYADVFVYLDTVQFNKNGLQNRNQVKTNKGATWLTLPVRQRLGQSISGTRVADLKALAKHFKTLSMSYAGRPGFERWKTELENVLTPDTDSLCAIAIKSTEWMLEKLGVQTRRIRASEVQGNTGRGSVLIASICKSLGATLYLSGRGALQYMNPGDFDQIGCKIMVQSWRPFTYEQAHPEVGFTKDLSTLDLLLNCPETAAEMIRAAGDWQIYSPQ